MVTLLGCDDESHAARHMRCTQFTECVHVQVYMLSVIFVFAAAWSIELAIYHYSMKGTRPGPCLREVRVPC